MMANLQNNVWVLGAAALSVIVVLANHMFSVDVFSFLGGFGGFLTGLFTIGAVVVASLLAGALFKGVAITVSPAQVAKAFRTMPLTASFGLLMIILYTLVAIFAPALAPYSETQVVGREYEPWSAEFLLGTDNLGRDMLSRLIYAARNTVGIAFATTALAFVAGSVLGLLAAVVGGWLDQVLSRIVDVLMAIPALIFALLLLTIVGTSVINMILVIALIDSTRVYRLARAVAMNIVVMDYVEAARLRGEGLWRLITREILPNAMAPLVAEFGLRFCFVFLTISALSFLGLGIQPPTADWGSMVRDNATLISFGDITPLLPAGCIALLTVSVNFVVDWQLHRASGLKE
jgi:peptide/nickel transport system permease protein